MAKKKLLIYISNLAIGGAQNMVYELIKKIKNYDVEVLCHSSRLGNFLEEKIEQVSHVTYLGFEGKITLLKIIKSLKLITKINPEVIHCHLGTVSIGIIWCILHNKRCVVTVHTRPDVAFSKKNEFWLKIGMKKKVTTLVAVSKENQELCYRYFHDRGVQYVNNGIDINLYKKKEHSIFTFLHVARQDKNKNTSFIVDCFKKVIDDGFKAKLILLGDGEEHQNLFNQISSLKLQKLVELPGNAGNTPDYFAVSDCFLLASHREALPMTCIEALAVGIPIISTDVGGIKDIVKGNGFLVNDGDFDNFYSKMEHLIMNKIDNIEEVSSQLALCFSSEEMARKYECIYSE